MSSGAIYMYMKQLIDLFYIVYVHVEVLRWSCLALPCPYHLIYMYWMHVPVYARTYMYMCTCMFTCMYTFV